MKTISHIEIAEKNQLPATKLYCEYHTQGEIQRDVMIMLPGGPGNDHSTYDTDPHSMTEALLPYVDIILFDPRGCGKSEASEPKYCDLNGYTEDIEAIRQHFKLTKDRFIVFGQSYGSIAAINYVINYPQHVKKLFLIGGVASGSFLEEALDELAIKGTDAQKYYIDVLRHGTFSADPKALYDYYETMGPLYSTTFKPGSEQPTLTYNPDITNYGLSVFLKSFDFRGSMNKITCPTLILWGEDEWFINKKQVMEVHKEIRNSHFIIYKNCGHLLWIDQWERFLKDAIHFLTK